MSCHGETHNAETEKSDFSHVCNLGVSPAVEWAGPYAGDGRRAGSVLEAGSAERWKPHHKPCAMKGNASVWRAGHGFMLGSGPRQPRFHTTREWHRMSVGVLDHFNIRTRKLADTVRFYEDILGLEKGARPNFAFPGAWMYSEGKPVVHLVDISQDRRAAKAGFRRGPSCRLRQPRFCRHEAAAASPRAWSSTRGRFPAAISGRFSSMTPTAS